MYEIKSTLKVRKESFILFPLFLAYNRRFGTHVMRKHPNIWIFIRLIQDEHIRFEQITIQLVSEASNPKQSLKKTAFNGDLKH